MRKPKETGVLFNGDMVRAIMSGEKTQSRRLIRPNTIKMLGYAAQIGEVSYFINAGELHKNDESYIVDFSPGGITGDKIWVRETTSIFGFSPSWEFNHEGGGDDFGHAICSVAYRSDGEIRKFDELLTCNDDEINEEAQAQRLSKKRSCPSIHMPKWAARTWLEITSVKVDRLQDIGMEDAIAEGVEGFDQPTGGDDYQDYWRNYLAGEKDADGWPWFAGDPIASFRSLWISIYGQESWDSNPWVFSYQFKLISQ